MSTNRFSSWSRIAITSAAVASLAVVAACSEGSVASNLVAPSSVKFGQSYGPGIANAKLATICVTGPNGTYTFQNSGFLQAAGGTTVENAADGTPYTLIVNAGNPNPCVDVLTRTTGAAPTDAFSAATVTNTGAPANVNYSTTNCVDDPGVTATNPCGQVATIHSNLYHGSKSTFVFVAAPPVSSGCTYTFGWYKNQGNGSVPNSSFFGTAATWKQVIATKGGSNKYYGLADQYIPAKLAIGAGTPPASIAQALADAEAFFTGRALGSTTGYSQTTLTTIAATLDNFNNGNVAGWPHC